MLIAVGALVVLAIAGGAVGWAAAGSEADEPASEPASVAEPTPAPATQDPAEPAAAAPAPPPVAQAAPAEMPRAAPALDYLHLNLGPARHAGESVRFGGFAYHLGADETPPAFLMLVVEGECSLDAPCPLKVEIAEPLALPALNAPIVVEATVLGEHILTGRARRIPHVRAASIDAADGLVIPEGTVPEELAPIAAPAPPPPRPARPRPEPIVRPMPTSPPISPSPPRTGPRVYRTEIPL
jgi:hypothetical protein